MTVKPQPRLTICPLPLDEANTYVKQHHRHHVPVIGHKFSIGVADETGEVRGVAIVGRPVARGRDDGPQKLPTDFESLPRFPDVVVALATELAEAAA